VTNGQRSRARRARLLADNRCINCAEKLSFDDIGTRQECGPCRAARAVVDAGRLQGRRDAGECPMCGEDVTGDYVCCPSCRKGARERFAENVSARNPNRNGPQRETRWKDAELGTRCARCGLLEPHECMAVAGYASARRTA
jgi:hypothetical protein